MRKMIWVKDSRHEGWGCSECAWVFNPSGPPLGGSMEDMKRNFESQRAKEFTAHVCAQHPRAKGGVPESGSAKDKPKFPR
jgi:rubredoxin